MTRQGGRAQKVADQIQRELSAIVQRELRDPRVGMITLTGVEVSPDCARATVYFTCLDSSHVADATAGLRRAGGFLRTQLAKRIKLYAAPELRFRSRPVQFPLFVFLYYLFSAFLRASAVQG